MPTTSQRLGSVIKACRDTMRKDKGLNGDLDRLPMLTWIMFLKFLDDMDRVREDEARMGRRRFHPTIERPYRWRDWSAAGNGSTSDGDALHNPMTGDALTSFINHDEAIRPDGGRGLGLFAYLRTLRGADGGDRRDVVAAIFGGAVNRMQSGYLLRDVLDKVNEIHFSSSEEIHTLGHLYESLLKEVRDAAGDSGEFYTPRPVVRFMVEAIDPRLGETILDPACGTGGFLVESYVHLREQCRTVQDLDQLAKRSIFGGEAKPLPYLLAEMNLLLHGMESPEIDPGNSLRHPLREIGHADRVDVILTNPPFGGEEERGILGNFPEGRQTTETALLFLQLIMRKLRRPPIPGRAAVVVPNTTLFYQGVAGRIREELLREFRLTAIVRLPKGVFEPYTDIETNLLFFDASGETGDILYYRLRPPAGRKQYTKTQPLRLEDLGECLQLLRDSSDNSPDAWRVSAMEILSDPNCMLDQHNPKDIRTTAEAPVAVTDKLASSLSQSGSRIEALRTTMERLQDLAARRGDWMEVRLGDVLQRRRDVVEVENGVSYKRIRIRVKGRGVVIRDELDGTKIGTKRQFGVHAGQFVLSKIDARNGAFGIVPEECEGAIITGNFWAYDVDDSVIRPRLLHYLTFGDAFRDFCMIASPGATNRRYLQEDRFLEQRTYVPRTLAEQDGLIEALNRIASTARSQEAVLTDVAKQTPVLLQSALHTVFGGTERAVEAGEQGSEASDTGD